MKIGFVRARVVRVVAVAVLAVAFGGGGVAAGVVPGVASAAPTATAVQDRSGTAAPIHPDTFWVYFGTYPTLASCLAAGEQNFARFKCVATKDEGGTAWILYYGLDVCTRGGLPAARSTESATASC